MSEPTEGPADAYMADLMERALREIAAADAAGALIPFTLDCGTAMILAAQLHLALRHPGNTGASADLARQIIRNLIEILEPGAAEAGEQLRRGAARRAVHRLEASGRAAAGGPADHRRGRRIHRLPAGISQARRRLDE